MAKAKRKAQSKRAEKRPEQGSKAQKPKKTTRPSKSSKPRTQAQPFRATIFTVTNAHLSALTPEAAVELLSGILWAEARRIGIPTTGVNISARVDVPDGGIDATVSADAGTLTGSVVKAGGTGFQVKAGTGFEPWKKSHIAKALFDEKPPRKESLGPSVRDCLDEGGTYVLVCTGSDLPEAQERQARDHLREFFSTCGYRGAKVEIWSQNKLIGILGQFPSLSLKVNGREQSRFQTHRSWSQEAEMKKEYQAGKEQRKFISTVQSGLSPNDNAVHIRVIGEPGIGKTRAVLEATAGDDLAPLILYCDSAPKFRDSELMNELLKEDNRFSLVLVVDECDPDARSYIWNKCANLGPRIKLISIYNEPDPSGGTTVYVAAPALEKQEIISILHEYGVPGDRADRWAEFCSGSPRVAHVIGANLRDNPDDMLKSPDTVNVWDRYIVGRDDQQSERVRQRRTVLEYLALFKRFGYGPRVGSEARAIAALIKEADTQITFARFEEIVGQLQNRKILQGENTLYITPKALHIKLWADWWDKHGGSFDPEVFAKLDGNLPAWFDEMFKYAAESEAALAVVSRLLGENGPFVDGRYLEDRRGARLFLALTEADPKRALECLKRTVGARDREALLHFREGRREVVWALERIVIWRELFADGARLLLRLAESENETWGNNATGIFAGLFSAGRGAVAPTEASLEERFPVLKAALESDSGARREVALKAADAALEARHFSRLAGAEHQGLKKEPQLWIPQTWSELLDGYRRVWGLLSERLDQMPEEERKNAIRILLSRARGLASYLNLKQMVIDTLTALSAKPYADRKEIIATIEKILHFDGKAMPTDVRDQWRALRNSLIGTGFHALMERYVAMDLLEDKFDDDGKQTDKAGPKIEELATQVQQEPALLNAELPWLVTSAAKNGFRFGYMVGSRDGNWSHLPRILDALRNAGEDGSAFFVGGYFRALREKDSILWEETLDTLADDERLRSWVPELTWRSGPSDRAMLRVLELARRGLIPISAFRVFAFGGVIQDIAEDVFQPLIEFLLGTSELDAVFIALDLYHFYYDRKESRHPLPRDLTLRLLTEPRLFTPTQRRAHGDMDDYYWAEIAKAFVHKYPDASVPLADVMLEHFGEDGTIVGGFRSEAHAVLVDIVERVPKEVWRRITRYLGPPIDARAYHLQSWLRGDEFQSRGEAGVLPLIPLDELWRWVDEDVEKRAWYVASLVPKQLFREAGKLCLAREVLVRYGRRADVRRNLMANFSSESWWGPESLHYQGKKERLLEFKKDETDPNAERWIDEYVAALDEQIARAQIEEEREH